MFQALIAEAEAVNLIPGEPWWYGVAGAVALLAALFVVTRFNPKR